MGQLVKLTGLYFDDETRISGTILKTLIPNYDFSKRVMIQRSDTDTPTLQHSHVSGSIPKEIGGLVALTYLSLGDTRIEGTLKIKEMKLCTSQVQENDSCDSQLY